MRPVINVLWTFAGTVAVLLLGSGTSLRADPTPDDHAVARALFDEARSLYADGNYDGACPKFAESARLDPTVVRWLNTGLCFEKQHRTRSAWVAYDEGARLGKSLKDDHTKDAEQHRDAIEPTLVKLEIDVADSPVGLEVKRDDAVVSPSQFGLPIAVDPGQHMVVATAPGRVRFAQQVSVSGDGTTTTFAIPILSAAPPPAAVTPILQPKFDAAATMKVLRSVAYADCGVGGSGKMILTFASSGAVTSVLFTSTVFSTPTRDCIEKRFKAATVPKFDGGDQSLVYILTLPTPAPAPSTPPIRWYCADFGRDRSNCYRTFSSCLKVADDVPCTPQPRAGCVTSTMAGPISPADAESRGWCRLSVRQCAGLGMGSCAWIE